MKREPPRPVKHLPPFPATLPSGIQPEVMGSVATQQSSEANVDGAPSALSAPPGEEEPIGPSSEDEDRAKKKAMLEPYSHRGE